MKRTLAALAVIAALAGAPSALAATPILGEPTTTPARAAAWARAHGASPTFVRLAPVYWQVARARGVRPEVAYALSAKETAFGNFTGVLDPSFRNVCGLKVTAGGRNDDPGAHQRFASWRQGIVACVDHLALYAGQRGYPKRATPDPRHFPFLAGRAPTVEALGGTWAPSPSYGTSLAALVRSLG
jgi:hypothetical protein